MTTKSVNFESDCDNEQSVALSDSSRISLTDITEATIGNLSQWADNCDRSQDTAGNVLLPWEDNSDPENTEFLSKSDDSNQIFTKQPPPTYHEHKKRHLDVDDADHDRPKRQRTEPTRFHQIPVAITSFYQKNSEMCKKRIIPPKPTTNVHPSESPNTQHDSNQMAVANTVQDVMNTNNTLMTLPQPNCPLQEPQSIQKGQQQQQQIPTMNVLIPTNPNSSMSYQNYLPWIKPPVVSNQTNTVNQAQEVFISPAINQNVHPIQLVSDQNQTNGVQFQQPLATHQVHTYQPQLYQPVIIQPQNDTALHSQVLPVYRIPTSQPSAVCVHPEMKMNIQNEVPPNYTISRTAVQPTQIQPHTPTAFKSSSQQLLPKVIDSISAVEDTNQTPFNLKNLQAAIGCDESNMDQNYLLKEEPKTPIGKFVNNSTFDSPAMDSRFTESLYSLLGSPPPDSPMSKNPILGDLQALLNRECKKEIIPQSLFGMQGTKNESGIKLNVFKRERNLQDRFIALQSGNPEEVRQLSSMFRYQSAMIETDRFRTLHESQYPGSYKDTVNCHYDNQLHKVMDRVEKSIQLMENSSKENQSKKLTKFRPHLSKESVKLMENWYQQNLSHPYPTSHIIEMLAQAGNIEVEQVKKWFANKRNRNSNTRSLTEIAMQKRKLGQMPGQC